MSSYDKAELFAIEEFQEVERQNRYDGDGNRVAKTVNGQTTFYLVDTNNLTGYAQVVEELRSGVGVVKAYTYGTDLISQRQGMARSSTSTNTAATARSAS
jgi:hypothetical protein